MRKIHSCKGYLTFAQLLTSTYREKNVLQMKMTFLFRYLQIRELADEEILHDLDVFFE